MGGGGSICTHIFIQWIEAKNPSDPIAIYAVSADQNYQPGEQMWHDYYYTLPDICNIELAISYDFVEKNGNGDCAVEYFVADETSGSAPWDTRVEALKVCSFQNRNKY